MFGEHRIYHKSTERHLMNKKWVFGICAKTITELYFSNKATESIEIDGIDRMLSHYASPQMREKILTIPCLLMTVRHVKCHYSSKYHSAQIFPGYLIPKRVNVDWQLRSVDFGPMISAVPYHCCTVKETQKF